MKFFKLVTTAIFVASISFSSLMAENYYNKGFEYYYGEILPAVKLQPVPFLHKLGIKNAEQLNKLFENDAEPFIKLLQSKGYNKAAKIVEEIRNEYPLRGEKSRIKRLHGLRDFFIGVLDGRYPPVCS